MLADDHRTGVSIILELVPRLCLGMPVTEALPRLRVYRGSASPPDVRAWERVVKLSEF